MNSLSKLFALAFVISLLSLSFTTPRTILAGGKIAIVSPKTNDNLAAQQGIKCGDRLRITHVATGAHLHSHTRNYEHPGTSGQQQITAYSGTDYNDIWIEIGRAS